MNSEDIANSSPDEGVASNHDSSDCQEQEGSPVPKAMSEGK